MTRNPEPYVDDVGWIKRSGSTTYATAILSGIRAPFANGKHDDRPTSTEAFIAPWKRRVAANAR
jgi:hypothetical protein